MNTLIWILISTIAISLLSLIGVFSLFIKKDKLYLIVDYLVSLSIGGLIAGAFFHLIPESAEEIGLEGVFICVILGMLLFFLIEKILHWRHCHEDDCAIHTFALTNLFGDSIHNFLDGLVVAAAFLTSVPAGITTSLAIIIHEIPQEIGDFGVLIKGGFKAKKALMFNLFTALIAVIGGIVGFFALENLNGIVPYILGIAAGGFIYIAASDLIPEIRKEMHVGKTIIHILVIAIGIVLMFTLKFLE